MLKMKQLEKAVGIYERIKQINADIDGINHMAQLAAGGEVKCTFHLALEDVVMRNEQSKKEMFDSEGFLKNRMQAQMHGENGLAQLFGSIHRTVEEAVANRSFVHHINAEPDESTFIELLGVLHGRKMKERQVYLDQLKSIGIIA